MHRSPSSMFAQSGQYVIMLAESAPQSENATAAAHCLVTLPAQQAAADATRGVGSVRVCAAAKPALERYGTARSVTRMAREWFSSGLTISGVTQCLAWRALRMAGCDCVACMVAQQAAVTACFALATAMSARGLMRWSLAAVHVRLRSRAQWTSCSASWRVIQLLYTATAPLQVGIAFCSTGWVHPHMGH